MKLLPAIFGSLIFASSCSATNAIDESCFYKVESGSRLADAEGQALAPNSKISNILFDQYANDRRSHPPLADDGIVLFADSCDLQASENFVDDAFSGTQFNYRLTEISKAEYYRLADELGLILGAD